MNFNISNKQIAILVALIVGSIIVSLINPAVYLTAVTMFLAGCYFDHKKHAFFKRLFPKHENETARLRQKVKDLEAELLSHKKDEKVKVSK